MSMEHKLLSLLTDPQNIDRVYGMGLKPEAFEEPLSQYVYSFIIEYWLSSQMTAAPTAFAIETERPGFRLDIEVEEEAWWLTEKLLERCATNRVQEMVRQAASDCNQDPIGTLKQLQAASYDAAETIAPRHSRSDMSDFEARRTRYLARQEGRESGIAFGLDQFDENTGGILPGEICAVGGYAKTGKSFFLLYVAAAVKRAGYNPIVFSLEMSKEEMEDRLDALFSGVSYSRLSRSKLTVNELQQLHQAQEVLAEMGGVLIESPQEGERTVAYLTARARHTGADVILVDQLSFMEETIKTSSEKQRQASILKQLDNEIGNPARRKLACVLAVQLRRESQDRPEGLELRDFADAAEVERTCDLLLALSRNREQRSNRVMKLDILGGRRCDTGSFLLKWDLVDQTRIEVLERITR